MTGSQTARALEDHDPCVDLVVAGERLICDWAGCLYWPDEDTMVVSDLHLEKGSSFAEKGSFVPPHDTKATLARLALRLAVWQPARVISLGDSFHDPLAHERLSVDDSRKLNSLMEGREWFWISGNHDPAPPESLGGKGAREMMLGNLVFRHEPGPGSQTGEIAGHLHPCGKIVRRSKSVRRPCFVTDGSRLILPSFGAFTGGLNIRHEAFEGLFDEAGMSAVLLGKGRVFHISAKNLVA